MVDQIEAYFDVLLSSGWLAEGGKCVAGALAFLALTYLRSFWRTKGKSPDAEQARALPAPERSDLLKAFLEALRSEKAAYEPAGRHLTAPGVLVEFDKDGHVSEILTDEARLLDLLPGNWCGAEAKEAVAAACARRDEVVERDRHAANLHAAAKVLEAQRQAKAPAPSGALASGKSHGEVQVVTWDDGRQAWVPTTKTINVLGSQQPASPMPHKKGA